VAIDLDLRSMRKGASHFCNPHPKSLSQVGRGTWILLPFSPFGRRGWGMRGFWRILHKTEMLPILRVFDPSKFNFN